jgi:hypothetical protein
MRLPVTMIAVALAVVVPCWADTVITMKTHSDAVEALGAPETNETSVVWLTSTKMRQDKEGQSLIVDSDAKKMYIVKHAEAEYHALDLPLDLVAMVPEAMRDQFAQMVKQMEMTVGITPTEETREISGYAAKLYKINLSNGVGMNMDMDLWLTTDVKLDVDAYKRLTNEMLSAQSMGGDWIKQILAIEGFRVLQETTISMMGSEVKAREELVSIEEKEAPAGNYAPPADYTEKPFDLMQMMTGG